MTIRRTAGLGARLRGGVARPDARLQHISPSSLGPPKLHPARRIGHRCARLFSSKLRPHAPTRRALHQHVQSSAEGSTTTTSAAATSTAQQQLQHEEEEVPFWQIGVAGVAVGLGMGVTAWYFTTPTTAARSQHDGDHHHHHHHHHPEYQLFLVHPPGKNADEEEIRRVEMEIQDLEDEFEEHEAKLREAQCECEHFEVAHPMGVWEIRSWRDVVDWWSFQAVKWTVESERNILSAIEDKENARIRYKLQLLRGQGGARRECRKGEKCDNRLKQDKS